MTVGSVAGRWGLRAGAIVVFTLLLVGSGYSAVANSDDGSVGIGVVVDAGTPEDGEPASGDPASSPPAQSPLPEDEPDDTHTEVATPTPESSDGRDNEAVAPGTVTVVLWTSDRNPLPNRVTVCVGDICQSGAGMRSGVSFWFDEVEAGWQRVTIQVGAPYGSTTATVEVREGSNGLVELTLTLVEAAPVKEVEPSLPEEGLQRPVPGQQQSESAQTTSASSSMVSALPATGSVLASGSAGLSLLPAGLAFLAATAAGGFWVTRRTDRGA